MATTLTYGSLILKAFNKEIDWDTDVIKVALVTSSYTPAQDTHDYWDDVSANEASGTGYTAGGATLGSKTQGYTAGTNVTVSGSTGVRSRGSDGGQRRTVRARQPS